MSDTKEVQTTQQGPQRVQTLIKTPAFKKRFEDVLGSRAPAFISSVISAVNGNAQLKQCEPTSVIGAAATAAAMDLPISPGLGLAHIVPYKTKGVSYGQFQIGWKGFVQLAMRSGQYKTINATPILEGQLVDHNPFTGEMEFQQEAVSDKKIGYLLYFKLLNGYEKYYYMTKEQCEAHAKRYSKIFSMYGKGMWKDDFDSMALKTVVKMGLSKYGILSVDMQKAVELDQADVSDEENVQYPDSTSETEPEPGEPTTKASRLSAAVKAKTGTKKKATKKAPVKKKSEHKEVEVEVEDAPPEPTPPVEMDQEPEFPGEDIPI